MWKTGNTNSQLLQTGKENRYCCCSQLIWEDWSRTPETSQTRSVAVKRGEQITMEKFSKLSTGGVYERFM